MALQTLSNLNIVNGNTIQAADVSQSIDAFTGAVGYAISLSGSFTFTGATTGSGFFQNAVSSSRAISSSYALSSSVAVSSSYALSSSAAVSSSYAVSASYVTVVNNQNYDTGVTVVPGDFKFIAGKTAMTAGAATSSLFTVLAGKVIGDTVWINASYPEAFSTTPGQSLLKVNVSSSGQVLISGAPSDTGTIIFTGTYI
jgi:hypothetical protein